MGHGSVHNNIDSVSVGKNAIVVQARNVTGGINTTTRPVPAPSPADRDDATQNDG